MATLDGYNPYGCGLTAKQVVDALRRGHNLEATLKNYAFIASTTTPPTYDEIDTVGEFWYNEETGKLYRAFIDQLEKIVCWFQIA